MQPKVAKKESKSLPVWQGDLSSNTHKLKRIFNPLIDSSILFNSYMLIFWREQRIQRRKTV